MMHSTFRADTIGKIPAKTGIVSAINAWSYEEFPVSVFPEPIRSYVVQAGKAIGLSVAFVALPMLSALAAAVGLGFRIRLKEGWFEPAVVWTCTVADSGSGKTPALNAALEPLERYEARAIKEYENQLSEYETEKAEYEKELARWRREKGGDTPASPSPPVCARYIVTDITVEALAKKLRENPRGLLVKRDEFAGVMASFSQYKGKSQGSDCHNYLSMFNAGAMRVDRKTGDSQFIHVPRAAVSMTGSIQPKILSRCLTAEYRDNGFAARLLMAAPPRQPRRWSEEEIPDALTESVNSLFDILLGLSVKYDERGDIIPTDFPLAPQAKRRFVQFVNDHAQEQFTETTGELAAVWSKLECYAARFALIFHLVRVAAGDESLLDMDRIDEQSIQDGITLARWFGREARRIYAMLNETDDEQAVRELIDLIAQRGGEITARDLMRATRKYKVVEDAEAELTSLAEHDLGAWYMRENGGPGRPVSVFRLHPTMRADTIAENTEKNIIVSARPANYEPAFERFSGMIDDNA